MSAATAGTIPARPCPLPLAAPVALHKALLLALALVTRSALAQPGAPDPTFGGGDGFVLADLSPDGPGYDEAEAIALHPNGSVVLAGSRDHALALARFLSDGALDPSFGTGGGVLTNFGDASEPYYGEDVALLPDGRVLVAGQRGGFEATSRLLLARFLPDGTPDPTFGTDGTGLVLVDTPGEFDRTPVVALQPDGEILLAGTDSQGGHLARFLPDGSLDPTFGAGGFAELPLSALTDVAVLPDGRIVAGGQVGPWTEPEITVLRLHPDGTPDATFGTGGLATTDLGWNTAGVGIALDADGGVLVLAQHRGPTYGLGYSLIRHLPSGEHDASFGEGGVVRGAEPLQPTALVLQPDGRALVAGYNPSYQEAAVVLARHHDDGVLDPAFGVGGLARPSFGGTIEGAAALALQGDERLLVAGTSSDIGSEVDVVLARLLGDAAVAVGAAPAAPPVVIPAQGGAVSFTLTLANVTGQPQTVDVWTEADGPVAVSPALGPRSVRLPPSAVVTRTVTQRVPAAAPAGAYTYTVHAGAFPGGAVTHASFPISKEGARRAARPDVNGVAWETDGWTEVGEAVARGSAVRSAADLARAASLTLSAPSPNPLRGTAHFRLTLPSAQRVRVTVYDALGREVAVLHDGSLPAGAHTLALDGRALTPGVYVVRAAGTATVFRRVVVAW